MNTFISECERLERQQAVDFARASLALEGFKLSEIAEKESARFVAGEVNLAEFLKALR